jgi:hypothetical protein
VATQDALYSLRTEDIRQKKSSGDRRKSRKRKKKKKLNKKCSLLESDYWLNN